jgi:hypothetical protein
VAGRDDFSALYDLTSGLPVMALEDVANLIVWQDPTQAVGYDKRNKIMVRYNLLTQSISPLSQPPVSRLRRPQRFLNNGRLILLDDGELYDPDSGQITATPQQSGMAFSESGRYVGWYASPVAFVLDLATMGLSFTATSHPAVFKTLGVVGPADLLISSYSYGAGQLTFIKAGKVAAEINDLEDLLGEVVVTPDFAYVGADGNPLFGTPTIYRLNLGTARLDPVLHWPGSTVRLTPRGNVLAATSRPTTYAYSFYYRAAVFSLPALAKLSPEISLPGRLTSLSVVGQ